MRTMILAAVAAIGLSLGSVAPAKAQYWARQYYYYPNTAYAYSYAPGTAYSYYRPYTSGYYPYTSSYYTTPYWNSPYVSGYTPGAQYYNWDWYNPYTNQYRTWRWYRRY